MYLSVAQKNFATCTVVLEVGKHILSAIVISTKNVIMTDNVVRFCVSKVVPTGSWGGGVTKFPTC